jgi:hypothetical protein
MIFYDTSGKKIKSNHKETLVIELLEIAVNPQSPSMVFSLESR